MRSRSGIDGGTFRLEADDDLTDPERIEVDDCRWAVARGAPGAERRSASELAGEGFRPYCPLGRKRWLRARVRGSWRRRRLIRQFAVFSPYLFVGCPPGIEIGRDVYDRWGDKIGTVLSDAAGPLFIAPRIIAEINALEIAGAWWEDWAAQTRLRPGAAVVVKDGPFLDMRGIIKALPAEMRVRVDLCLFGGATPVELSACQVALV